MKRKFKSGDRVRTAPNLTYFDSVGTVVGYDDFGIILVKFDNFTNGHSGSSFYSKKGIKYDPNNRQHSFLCEEKLCLLEE